MLTRLVLCLAALVPLSALAPLPALAEEFQPVTAEAAFLALVEGRQLRIGLLGLGLQIGSGGQITGRAAGQDITGTWVWQDGFFCREMAWGSNAIPYDCQLVEVKGSNEIRFTVDRGAGDDATFVIR